ncbi:ammonium transporter [Novosphingobium sp. Leaf2]|uniref:ammonium transporter n=1 Tax=Novosphingobium sp. Leaf2 TaxID=1735670 RepID=UPI0006FE9808|nr:ammonium transporter [Novosphingobium sp. Leaf2]KQM19716.1 ammonium transporter [Novosphingobium sp. Leaf2]
MTKRHLMPPVALLTVLPTIAIAQDGRIDVADSGDTAWLLAAAVLSFLTVPGIALFHAGRIHRRNAGSVMLQCLGIMALVSVLWVTVGYTLAFGQASGGWLGQGNAWMLMTLGNVRGDTAVPESAFALFQLSFAVLAPALMTGAWAERARFGWVMAFAGMWSLVVYAPVAHWIWGGGWVATGVGTLDWAGGIVVNLTAGVSSLAVAAMLGRRKGQTKGDNAAPSPLLALTGGALLWIGWLAMIGGSALAASDDAAAAIIAGHVAAAAGALVWGLLERMTAGTCSLIGVATGAVAGLASISAGAGYVSPGAAIVIGAIGGGACYFATRLMRGKLAFVDDALGIMAVHGIGGAVGAALLAPFLAERLGGVGYGQGMNAIAQVVAQGVGITVVTAWAAVASVILAVMASIVFPMRVSEETESLGLDIATHGAPGSRD